MALCATAPPTSFLDVPEEVAALCWMAEQIAVERARSPGCPGQHTYVRRQPERTVLHHVVREHLETFLAEARLRGGGDGLPRFVERELREFLTCGALLALEKPGARRREAEGKQQAQQAEGGALDGADLRGPGGVGLYRGASTEPAADLNAGYPLSMRRPPATTDAAY